MCVQSSIEKNLLKKSKKSEIEIEIAGKYQKIQTLGRNQLKKMEGNTVQQALSKYLIIDTAGFIKNPPLQEFGQNLITLREVIGKKHMQWRPTGHCTQCTCTGCFLPQPVLPRKFGLGIE